jgi:long-chain acyl-CoA synthetase
MANRAISSKLYYLKHYGTVEHGTYDKLVCAKFKETLGGQVRFMCTGSAPISVDVINFLKVCFCCPMVEGYGSTESCAASCITMPEDNVAGHVGGPVPSIKIKLRDVPEMGYCHQDTPFPRGEICFAGPSVFPGYFKNPEKNAEAFHDGWLMSGDVGVIMPNGSVKIIDRAKNIFKLA